MFGETVQIIVGVGDEQKSFILHKDILRFYSSYFRAALDSDFVEGSTNKIEFLEEDVDTFERFVFWLYSRTFDRDDTWDFNAKIELWTFGDLRDIPLLQNLVINEIRNEVI